MASLPSDRTKLSISQNNDINGQTADGPKNVNALTEAYDTLDMLYNYALSLVTSGTLSPYPPAQYNNLINGNFDIWQRGTSFSPNNIYTADRWYESIAATAATITNSRQSFTIGQTAVPNNPKYFMRINPTVLTGCVYFAEEQRIEGVDKFAGEIVTVSFWAKADTTQNLSAFLRQNFGTGGSPSTEVVTTGSNIVLTTTLAKYTATFTLPSISGKTLGSNANDYVALGFNLPLVASYSIDIAQVQLNAGSIALPFQPKSYNQENLDSLRYLWRSWADGIISTGVGSISGYASSTSTLIVNVRFPVPMRISPTLSIQNNNVSNQVRNTSTGSAVAATYSSAGGPSNKGLSFLIFTGTPFTVGQYYDFDIIADAEL